MKRGILLFVFLIVISFSSITNADVISVNSGGDNQMCVNPGGGIGDCFFTGGIAACSPRTCSLLGYTCGNWSDGCGGTLDCGNCSSGYTCSSGTCTAIPGGVTGGGGVAALNIDLIPQEINLKMAVNTNQKEIIKITNNEATTKTLQISQSNLYKLVILGTNSITLLSGETKELEVIFVAPNETGIFTGRIIIGDKQVSVSLNIKTKLILFDSNVIVLNRNYKISQGKPLKTKVELIPMGDKERMDVTLNYVIKDYSGKIYTTKSETVLVEEKTSFYRNFETGNLPIGKYIIGLELVYPGGVAPSSAHFEIVERNAEDFLGFIMFTLIIAMLIVSIVIIALMIRVKMRKKESNLP